MEGSNEDTLQFNPRVDIHSVTDILERAKTELHKVIIGQDDMIEQLLIAIIANGHVLIEGVPGVAKTLTAKVLAKAINTQFSRIQFTPDLMPSDILGTLVFNAGNSDFEFKKGPIFSNIVLIDEINRAPAKTQAALFEVMEERQITIDLQKFEFAKPFLVVATQNPIEQEGTYRLPEAQLDRFLFKIDVGYPSLADEVQILQNEHSSTHEIKTNVIEQVIDVVSLMYIQKQAHSVRVENDMMEYIVKIVQATRNNPMLYLGASPRAAIAILNTAKARAILHQRDFIIPEDVKAVSYPVLGHRIILTPEKEMEGITGKHIISTIIDGLEVPR
ncbi:MAG: MoxR family ATPase [Saprospiraceae bacterium]